MTVFCNVFYNDCILYDIIMKRIRSCQENITKTESLYLRLNNDYSLYTLFKKSYLKVSILFPFITELFSHLYVFKNIFNHIMSKIYVTYNEIEFSYT